MLKELADTQGDEPFEVVFVCDRGFLKQSQGIMAELPFTVKVRAIPSGRLRRYAHFSWWQYVRHFSIVLANIVDIFKTIGGFFVALWVLAHFRPDVVFAKGGFVCLPVGYAARLLRVPMVIHDSDARPGLTNKLLARFAAAIGTGMPLENYSYNPAISQHVGVPISANIHRVTSDLQREYRQEMELPLDTPVVVAVGGSLGSVAINTAVADTAKATSTGSDVLFYNVTGVKNIDAAQSRAEGASNYIAVPFVYRDLHKLLGAADVVVARASATTLQELAGLGKAVIAVPAQQLGDQQQNARLFSRYDAVVTLQDDELASRLGVVIKELLGDEKRRSQLADSLHSFARPEAAKDMARIIQEVVR